jgi:hypothetical protein
MLATAERFIFLYPIRNSMSSSSDVNLDRDAVYEDTSHIQNM